MDKSLRRNAESISITIDELISEIDRLEAINSELDDKLSSSNNRISELEFEIAQIEKLNK
jgi:predicted nuclease with TOPRIM domain